MGHMVSFSRFNLKMRWRLFADALPRRLAFSARRFAPGMMLLSLISRLIEAYWICYIDKSFVDWSMGERIFSAITPRRLRYCNASRFLAACLDAPYGTPYQKNSRASRFGARASPRMIMRRGSHISASRARPRPRRQVCQRAYRAADYRWPAVMSRALARPHDDDRRGVSHEAVEMGLIARHL